MGLGGQAHTLEDELHMMEVDLDMMEDDPKMYKIYHYFKLARLLLINLGRLPSYLGRLPTNLGRLPMYVACPQAAHIVSQQPIIIPSLVNILEIGQSKNPKSTHLIFF